MLKDLIKTKYDDELMSIDHFQIYKEMLPWIGVQYGQGRKKLLFVGESHYLGHNKGDTRNEQKPITYHLQPERWYKGVAKDERENSNWFMTRNIIKKSIANNWKLKSRLIYRNIEKVLYDSGLCSNEDSAFNQIAFMNYFQRPAEVVGKSIKVSSLDRDVSYRVWSEVVAKIEPDVVVFTSSLAWRNANKLGAANRLKEAGIASMKAPHPGCAWWNRKSKAYGNISGREALLAFLKEQS